MCKIKHFYQYKVNFDTKKRIEENKVVDTIDEELSDAESNSSFDENNLKTDYDWIKQRRKLRKDLNALDLDMNYLRRKKDLNDMEKRVFYKMVYYDKEIQTDTIVRKSLNVKSLFQTL